MAWLLKTEFESHESRAVGADILTESVGVQRERSVHYVTNQLYSAVLWKGLNQHGFALRWRPNWSKRIFL